MWKITVSWIIIGLYVCQCLHAQFKTEKIEQQIAEYVEMAFDEWSILGGAVGVIKNGEVIYLKGHGFTELGKEESVNEKTLFAIGSTSKAFTAAAVCKMAELGKISLDTPIVSYLPDFRLWDEYATQHMTARDLLSHRSGLPRHDLAWYGMPKGREELFQSLPYLEPTASFRAVYQYQNLMFMTAGYLIEKVMGVSWEEFIQEYFFDPLEMTSANFSVGDMQESEFFAKPYTYNWEEEEIIAMDFRNIDAIGPAGSINASVEEMLHWVHMQLNGGKFQGKEIISQASLMETHRPHMVVPLAFLNGTDPGYQAGEVHLLNYGLGWFISAYRGHLRFQHSGHIDGFSADVALFPEDSLGIVILVNQNGSLGANVMRNVIADLLLELTEIDWNERALETVDQNRMQAKEVEKMMQDEKAGKSRPSHSLSEYGGTYEHPAYGKIDIVFQEDSLYLVRLDTFPLRHYHYDVFEAKTDVTSYRLKFDYDALGHIHQVAIPLQLGVHDIVFSRVGQEKEIDQVGMSPYLGEYELMGQTLKVYVQDEELKLAIPNQPIYTLVPYETHSFKLKGLKGFMIVFEMDDTEEQAIQFTSHQPNGAFVVKRKDR